jgi:hypothetical protein
VNAIDLAQRALAEGATFRGVRRAKLVLPDRECEHATRHALEDALRTADFADAGRLIVVRALRLKGLPRAASGAQIARALEEAWQVLAPGAVAFDTPGAERATVVWFRSIHAARLAWLRRFARGEVAHEWFWPRALPELALNEPAHAMTSMLVALQRDASSALAAEIDSWPADAIVHLLATLPHAREEALLPVAPCTDALRAPSENAPPDRLEPHEETPPVSREPSPHTRPEAHTGASSTPPPFAAGKLAVLSRVLAAFAPHDWRVHWIAAILSRVAIDAAPDAARIAALVRAAQAFGMREPRDAAPVANASGDAAQSSSPAQVSPQVEPPLPRHATPRTQAARRAALTASYPWLGEGELSAFGGFLMLVNALEALGFSEWLARQPAEVRAHFGRALLARLAARLRMPKDDPHVACFHLDDAAHRALSTARCDGLTIDEAAWHWRRALGRALRTHARIGPLRLARRAAGVSVTPTHVDVVLPLAEADIAVRRVGLDRDPGWVPWLGWIVAFHYVEGACDGAG